MRAPSRISLVLALAASLAGLGAPRARATAVVTFDGAFNNPATSNTDTATATFGFSGADLTLVLTNTSTFGQYQNADGLSGLFFDISGNPGLTGTSATASGLVDPSATGPQNVSNRWGFQHSASGYTYREGGTLTTAQYGVAAAGYSSLKQSFGHSNFGSGPSNALRGLDYSIVGADFARIKGHGAGTLVDNAVTFQFSGLPDGFSLSDIGNVTFAYGTSPEGSVAATSPTGTGTSTGTGTGTSTSTSAAAPVPEPTTLVLMLSGLAALGLIRRRAAV